MSESDVETFLLELADLCQRYGVDSLGACTCCNGMAAYAGGFAVAEYIEVEGGSVTYAPADDNGNPYRDRKTLEAQP